MQVEQVSAEQILSSVALLSGDELERVVNGVLELGVKRRVPPALASETALLMRINQPWPEWRKRLDELIAKHDDDTISAIEDRELTRLIRHAEEWQAQRLFAIAELAKLRGMSPQALTQQLGITFPEYE